jgi:hypothetical protein
MAIPSGRIDCGAEEFSTYSYEASPFGESDSPPREPAENVSRRAKFDPLLRQFDQAVSLLEMLERLAERTGNDELKRLTNEELAAAKASRERIIQLRKLWWN